jgi:ligand-binding sensor domain-containing protein
MRRNSFRPFLQAAPWLGVLLFTGGAPAGVRAQSDQGVWTVYPPTGDVADIVIDGTIAWIGADGGVVRFDLSTSSSPTPNQRKIGAGEGLVDTDLTALEIDGLRNVWVGTLQDGISVFDSEGRHIRNLSSFEDLWSDLIIDIKANGSRVTVVSTDEYTVQGGLEGGGVVAFDVAGAGSGTTFTRVGFASVDLAQVVLPENDGTWIGTRGRGLWRSATDATDVQLVADQSTGLISNNVKKLVRGPSPLQGGASVLWIGTGAGMQTWDGATLVAVPDFPNQNILDLEVRGSTLLVLAEDASISRDLYQADLASATLAFTRIARSDCQPDTLYTPREAAQDASGRIVLGTRENAFSIREGFTWFCPPSLGPHFPQVSDLAVAPNGVLYFATGQKGPEVQGVGIGTFDGATWGVISTAEGLANRDVHEVAAWPDSTLWFGTAISAATGGVNHYFPATGEMDTYHDTVPEPDKVSLGKNCRSMEVDRFGNLWIVYGQNGGTFGHGLSVIEPGSLHVTNYIFNDYNFAIVNRTIRDIAFDSRDRLWVTSFSDQNSIGVVYVIDPRGTLRDTSDDILTEFNVANAIADIGTIDNIEIDATDQIWLAGIGGLVIGQITSDIGGKANATWDLLSPGVDQTGGRNPLPYVVAKLDADESIWLGTASAGVVNVSKDGNTWTWYDQEAGTPLPDQSIQGLHVEKSARRVWIGTSTGGIARIDFAATGAGTSERIEIQAYPNPWRPKQDGALRMGAVPESETYTLRVYDVSGDLVYEGQDIRGEKTWDGRNLGSQIVEAGTYLITATATNGRVYEGKVAVLR